MEFFEDRFPLETDLKPADRIYHYGPGKLLTSITE